MTPRQRFALNQPLARAALPPRAAYATLLEGPAVWQTLLTVNK